MSKETYTPPSGENSGIPLSAAELRLAVVTSRFNSFVTDKLREGALAAIAQAGGTLTENDIIEIPGAWEFPVIVRALAHRGYDAIICLGAVIRGDTPHFDYVAGEAARGIADASAASGVPMAFGILTTNTVEQATDRAGGKHGNKGFDAAMTAIEMALLLRKIRPPRSKPRRRRSQN
jgi:6,7-dimethyl-8-ribityllumazine synthase